MVDRESLIIMRWGRERHLNEDLCPYEPSKIVCVRACVAVALAVAVAVL